MDTNTAPATDAGPPPSVTERYLAACKIADDVPSFMWKEIADALRAEADYIDFTRSDRLAMAGADVRRSRAIDCDRRAAVASRRACGERGD